MLFQSIYGLQINIVEILIGISLLILIVVVFGHRRGASGIRHWALAAGKVVILYIIWALLSLCMFIIFMTYTSGPEEQRIFRSNIAGIAIFIGLCLILIYIEHRFGRNARS
jgi:ABC-type multidrug transport system permease subunit